jgi:hypothetical protein
VAGWARPKVRRGDWAEQAKSERGGGGGKKDFLFIFQLIFKSIFNLNFEQNFILKKFTHNKNKCCSMNASKSSLNLY